MARFPSYYSNRVPPGTRALIPQFAAAAGVSIDFKRDGTRLGWDGESIAGRGESCITLIHELAHWLVATPAQRERAEFALGPTTLSMHHPRAHREVLRSKTQRHKAERLTLLVQSAIQASMGLNYVYVLDDTSTWYYVNGVWKMVLIQKDLEELRARKILTRDVPRAAVKLGWVDPHKKLFTEDQLYELR
jgi:hypothetical protein